MTEFKEFDTEEEWLEARKRTIGATELADFIVYGNTADGRRHYVTEAMRYGSQNEHRLLAVAMEESTETLIKNATTEILTPGQWSWHDQSFYEDSELGAHASLDALVKNSDGTTTVVECKTGGKETFEDLDGRKRDRYIAQAAIEARIAGADFYHIFYFQRETDRMSTVVGKPMSREDLAKAVEDYHRAEFDDASEDAEKQTDGRAEEVLKKLYSAKAYLEDAEKVYEQAVEEFYGLGYKGLEDDSLRVTLVGAGTTTRMDWKSFREKYPDMPYHDFERKTETSAHVVVKMKEHTAS